jgi:hypothetical protein
MDKVITNLITVLISISLTTIGFSQSYKTAIGLKGGSIGGLAFGGGGVNLKHFIGGKNALEFTVGGGSNHIRGQALYEWQNNINAVEGLGWYIGAGGTVGAWGNKHYHPVRDVYYNNGLYLGANVVGGVDWSIEPLTGVPLDFAIDMGPYIGLINSNVFGWGGAFAVRYILK